MTQKPNIILILNDDMGYSDLGCYGGEVHTPNLDGLARNGLRFTQFYNCARCCPTRASLLTGLYPHQAGVGHMTERDLGIPGYRGTLNNQCVTIAEVLKTADYKTYMSGKWHVTRFTKPDDPKDSWPRQRGFDRFFGTIIGACSYFDPTTLTEDNTPIKAQDSGFYYTDAVSDHACRFIEDHVSTSPDVPFFLYTAYTAPHWPLQAPDEDIARYKGRYDRGWDVLRDERRRRMIEMGLIDEKWDLTDRDSCLPPWEDAAAKEWQARRMEVYAAQIDRMDQGIGRIIETLKRTGRLDNTLIFFLSDNGGCAEEVTDEWLPYLLKAPVAVEFTRSGVPVRFSNNPNVMPGGDDTYQSYGIPWANLSNTPFRLYKHWVHEGGIAAPFIVHWPRGFAGRNEFRHEVGHLIDVMATCVDVSGAEYPGTYNGETIPPMEGASLKPAFEGSPLDREAVYWEHEGNRAVRMGTWKLVAKGEEGNWELYDMEEDRTETTDLADRHPERVHRMADLYQTWAVRTKVLPNRPTPPSSG